MRLNSLGGRVCTCEPTFKQVVHLNVCLAMIEDGIQPDMIVLHFSPHGATIEPQPF